jgi:N-methylhydantoinase A/oxoprolinase/acetone carboxylase beta subunit
MSYQIGIDVGGTFTDLVATNGSGTTVTAKTPTTQSPTEPMKSSYRPNANDRPTHGAVHAATY